MSAQMSAQMSAKMSADNILINFIDISDITELKKIIKSSSTDRNVRYINNMVQKILIDFIKININDSYNCSTKEKVIRFRIILNHIIFQLKEIIDKIINQRKGLIYKTNYSMVYISIKDLWIIDWFIVNIDSIRLHYGY